MTSLVNGLEIRVPREFDRILPVSPCSAPFDFEAETWRGLLAVVRPGDTVVDAGASYGVFTTLLAHLVGPKGRVHSIEANPALATFARKLAYSNSLVDRIVQHSVALADRSGGAVEFHIVPGWGSPASTRNPFIRNFHADAVTLQVPAVALDDLDIRPAVIKMDIEGSEYLALQGAARLLREHKPAIVMETHADEITGIGGNMIELCNLIESYGYRLTNLETGAPTTADEFAAAYAERAGYLLAR